MRRPGRKSSILVPLIFIGIFLYMVNRQQAQVGTPE